MAIASDTPLGSKCNLADISPKRWLEIVLIFAVFFVAGGAPAPHVNETYYLTKAKHYWEPQWCAGDPFLESADAHLTFYWTVGWLAKWFSLPTVAWIGRVTAWLLLATAWQRLCSRVVDKRFLSVIAAMLFVVLVQEWNFAGEWVVGGVEGKCFAYAFVFMGLAALVDGRWQAVWPWFGLAGAFHVLVGGWSVVAAGLVWLTDRRADRATIKSMLPALVLGGALALPGIVPALQLTQGVSAETASEANQIYVFQRLPHHLAPLTLPSQELTMKSKRYGIVVFAFCVVWILIRKQDMLEKTTLSGLERLLKFALASLIVSALGLVWEVAAWNHPAIAAQILKYYWFRLADVAVPLGFSVALVWLASVLIERRSRWAPILLLAAVAYPSWHLYAWSSNRYQNPVPPADQKMKDAVAWKEACQWARENAPANAMFLVPRRSQSFEWYAHRKSLITWKDVPQDAASLIAWRDRYYDVFFYRDDEDSRSSYSSLAAEGAARVQQLAEKYEVDYVVTEEYPPLLLPVVYKNNSYAIYAITPPPTETP